MPAIPAIREAEAGESLEPGRQRLHRAEIVLSYSSLGDKSETSSQKIKENKIKLLIFVELLLCLKHFTHTVSF